MFKFPCFEYVVQANRNPNRRAAFTHRGNWIKGFKSRMIMFQQIQGLPIHEFVFAGGDGSAILKLSERQALVEYRKSPSQSG